MAVLFTYTEGLDNIVFEIMLFLNYCMSKNMIIHFVSGNDVFVLMGFGKSILCVPSWGV